MVTDKHADAHEHTYTHMHRRTHYRRILWGTAHCQDAAKEAQTTPECQMGSFGPTVGWEGLIHGTTLADKYVTLSRTDGRMRPFSYSAARLRSEARIPPGDSDPRIGGGGPILKGDNGGPREGASGGPRIWKTSPPARSGHQSTDR